MSTIYSDGLYSATNLGAPQNAYFTLSALKTEVVLVSAGTLSGSPVVAVGFNYADWQNYGVSAVGLSASGAPTAKNVLLKPYISGVAAADINTTISVGVSATVPLPFTVIAANGLGINLSYTAGTYTYAADLSAATYDISTPNSRRRVLLGFAG